MAPPSGLAWGVSKRATTDFANPSPWKVTCGIQAVAIQPPRVSAAKRVDTASIAPSRGSAALLSHRSRIIQGSVALPKSLYRPGRVDACRIVLLRRVSLGRIVEDRCTGDTRPTPAG